MSWEMPQAVLSRILDSGVQFVIGVDEVGYGAWAGPVTVCATVVKKDWSHDRVRDSKKLTAERRQQLLLSVLLPPNILKVCVASHSNQVIDKYGVTWARDDLVAQTVAACVTAFPNSLVVMDGNVVPKGLPRNTICLPKADDLVPAVSAASIIAKEHRDSFMREMHEDHPWYEFYSNVGYGTEAHLRGIEEHGLSSIHRASYRNLREYMARELKVRRFVDRMRGWRPSQSATPGSTRSSKR